MHAIYPVEHGLWRRLRVSGHAGVVSIHQHAAHALLHQPFDLDHLNGTYIPCRFEKRHRLPCLTIERFVDGLLVLFIGP